MKVEVRADGTGRISGYVNVTGKKSRPIIKPDGTRCVEVVEERTFTDAIKRAGNVTVTVDHDKTHVYASTEDNTLTIKEDSIGLHADVIIRDKTLIELAKKGEIKGWSFGMYNVIDKMEQRAEELPVRHITKLDLDHLTFVVNKRPCYAATSVELRANEEDIMEYRASDEDITLTVETPKNPINYDEFENRISKLKSTN